MKTDFFEKNIRYFAFLLLLVGIFGCENKVQQTDETEEEWIQLFNGKDLEDWKIKIAGYELGDNFNNTFRVEDGMLRVVYEEYDSFRNEFGHIFYKEPFSDYIVRVEYRFINEQPAGGEAWAYRNNGVMLHCQSPESMSLEQGFPVSIEGQLLGGNGVDERPNCNLCTPGLHVTVADSVAKQHCLSSPSKTFHGDDWITAEFIVHHDSLIQHIVEGDTVFTYSKPVVGGRFLPEDYHLPEGTPVKEGYIALQAESAPIDFRKVELKKLKSQ